MPERSRRRVPLARALSKLGILSRAQATAAILAGRVRVAGTVVRDPGHPVLPSRAAIVLDGRARGRAPWRTLLLHKPRGVVTTRSDPEGRRTVFDVVGETAGGLVAVGRLDLATSGLLLLTSDTALANAITDPVNAVPRVYLVTVRGEVTRDEARRLERGVGVGRDRLQPSSIVVRKASARETHLTLELREGKNREIRRLFLTIGHEVTRLKRVSVGDLHLGALAPGEWRAVTRDEVRKAFPGILLTV